MCDLNRVIKIKCNQQCIKEGDRKRSTAPPTWQISCICFEQWRLYTEKPFQEMKDLTVLGIYVLALIYISANSSSRYATSWWNWARIHRLSLSQPLRIHTLSLLGRQICKREKCFGKSILSVITHFQEINHNKYELARLQRNTQAYRGHISQDHPPTTPLFFWSMHVALHFEFSHTTVRISPLGKQQRGEERNMGVSSHAAFYAPERKKKKCSWF